MEPATNGMEVVTRERFYGYVGPRDIVVSSGREATLWKTREGAVVGKTNGYIQTSDVMDEEYWLKKGLT